VAFRTADSLSADDVVRASRMSARAQTPRDLGSPCRRQQNGTPPFELRQRLHNFGYALVRLGAALSSGRPLQRISGNRIDQGRAAVQSGSGHEAFTAIARRLGIAGVTLHSCRHAVATWALAGGADLRSVAGLLGHAAASTTLNLYGHVVAGGKERAVGMVAYALVAAQERLAAGTNGPDASGDPGFFTARQPNGNRGRLSMSLSGEE
jgi:Phage integrase family